MNSKEFYSIREWAPLTNVVDRIPTRINRGLFPADLNITCIDAVEEFLELGTDAGIAPCTKTKPIERLLYAIYIKVLLVVVNGPKMVWY